MQLTRTQTLRAHTPVRATPGRYGLAAWWRFARHYVEMVVAMLLGMLLLDLATLPFGDPPGYDTTLGMYLYMAVAMSAPMIAWMRRMGHPWRDCWEMTAWMVAPMFALVSPVVLDIPLPGLDEHSLMSLSHLAMLAGMAVLMLYRWDVYALGAHCHTAPASSGTDGAAKDPVCGMPVDPATAKHTAEHGGTTYAFCAPGCRKAFLRDPQRFLASDYTPSM